LLWGAVAFREFHGWSQTAVMTAVYGSILMTCGLAAIAFSVAGKSEYQKWRAAADREQKRYRIDRQFVSSGLEGKADNITKKRSRLDWMLVAMATAIFVWTGSLARWPALKLNWTMTEVLVLAGLALFSAAVISLWKVTRFN